MEVALIIAMFVCTALALNFMVNGRHKLSGTFEIINLCLIVATAYQFKLIKREKIKKRQMKLLRLE